MNGVARYLVRGAIAALLLGAVAFLFWRPQHDASRQPRDGAMPAKVPSAPVPPSPALQRGFIGERILSHYAEAARRPEDDLTDLAHALGNFALLVKGDNPLPLGANEDIASALRGKNRTGLRFLPDPHPAFNARGQLVDRWSTPLYFHANAKDRLDIRSAGPDRVMWTADDLHRAHDGRFLKGEDLLAPSLFDAPRSKELKAR